MNEIKNYKIKAIPKDGGEHYFIHQGVSYTDKEKAEAEVRSCNQIWGYKITFELVEDDNQVK